MAKLTSVNSGLWNDPSIWDMGVVPAQGDDVKIERGHSILYDIESSSNIRSIHVRGHLTFSRTNNTKLNIGLLVLNPLDEVDIFDRCTLNQHPMNETTLDDMPILDIGTLENPIPENVSVEINLISFSELDSSCGPAILNTSGILEINGSPVKTWVKLNKQANSGNTSIETIEETGWKVGDTILITGTDKAGGPGDSYRNGATSQTEVKTISMVNGNTLILDSPLQYIHIRNNRYSAEAAIIDRNITISAPNGSGHTMTHHRGFQRISYTMFDNLGIEDTLGRYPIHFHVLGNSSRGSYAIGNFIHNSSNKFITVHGTSYALIKENVGFKSIGHGFFLENGTETYNLLHRNLSILSYIGNRIDGQELSYDKNDGAGYWWANGMNAFVGNVAAECDTYGYLFDIRDDIYLPIMNPDGTSEVKQVERLPHLQFDNNEAHGINKYGFWGNGYAPEKSPIPLTNLKVWKSHYSVAQNGRNYYMENIEISDSSYGLYGPAPKDANIKNISSLRVSNPSFMLYHEPEGLITVDGLTVDAKRSDNAALRLTGKKTRSLDCEAHIKNLNILQGFPCTTEGGNAKDTPLLSMTIYDWFGDGRHAKVVPSGQNHPDGLTYRRVTGFEGEIKVAETSGEFPVSPIENGDSIPPVSAIISPRNGQSFENTTIKVIGTTIEKKQVQSVKVNGVDAIPTENNYLSWEATLSLPENSISVIEVESTDIDGIVEVNTHMIEVQVGENVGTQIPTPINVGINR